MDSSRYRHDARIKNQGHPLGKDVLIIGAEVLALAVRAEVATPDTVELLRDLFDVLWRLGSLAPML